jgi:hypothetical protein
MVDKRFQTNNSSGKNSIPESRQMKITTTTRCPFE